MPLAQVIHGNMLLKVEEITEENDGGNHGGDAGIEGADDEIRADDRRRCHPGRRVMPNSHAVTVWMETATGRMTIAMTETAQSRLRNLIAGSGPAHRKGAVKFLPPSGKARRVTQDRQVRNHRDVSMNPLLISIKLSP